MNVVTEMVSRHKDYIISEAIKEVAKKIYSSKACKDAAAKMLWEAEHEPNRNT